MIKKKIIKRILAAVWWAVVALLAVTIVSILAAKAKGKVPKIFGYSIMHILSGSMEEEIPTGSYILIKEIQPEKVQNNQIICFYSDDPQIYGFPNTHRVIGREQTEEGLRFITKGDANITEDTVTARAECLIGVYVKTLPLLTAFANGLQGNGIIFVLIGMQTLACGMAVYAFVKKKQSLSESEDKKENDQIDKEA